MLGKMLLAVRLHGCDVRRVCDTLCETLVQKMGLRDMRCDQGNAFLAGSVSVSSRSANIWGLKTPWKDLVNSTQ